MSMESDFEKREWVHRLWTETEHDEKAREFIFADLTDAEDLREEIRQELWDDPEYRDMIIDKLIDDPPSRLRSAIADELIDDPPEQLVDKLRERFREGQEDTIGDLKLTIASLEERLKNYKEAFDAYKAKHRSTS